MYKYKNEVLYIAGPEVFYTNGYSLWDALANKAAFYGMKVVMPSKNELQLDHTDLNKNADAIFQNCAAAMKEATAIIADLELFRGSEPDGGTVFEIGMAYAKGLRCYGFTRDKRDMVFKHQNITVKNHIAYDEEGRRLAYQDLPYCPCLTGACKIIEGGFDECLKVMMLDIDEERKRPSAKRSANTIEVHNAPNEKPLVYLTTCDRFDEDAEKKYHKMKAICARYGLDAVSPMAAAQGVEQAGSGDAYANAYDTLARYNAHVRNCDILIADLNNFHGLEPNSDIAFECGMAWQFGKKCFGFMENTAIMKEKIPHEQIDGVYKDVCDSDIENFDYPINLMFASSMPIFEGDFESAIAQIARAIGTV